MLFSPRVVVVMGVAGCGKTTVGKLLAQEMDADFADADDFHSDANRTKMANGVALTDADREPWLRGLREHIDRWIAEDKLHVLACSALKDRYRWMLNAPHVCFVYLKITKEEAKRRLSTRKGHYMQIDMVDSQFDALEEPEGWQAQILDASQEPDKIVATVSKAIHQMWMRC